MTDQQLAQAAYDAAVFGIFRGCHRWTQEEITRAGDGLLDIGSYATPLAGRGRELEEFAAGDHPATGLIDTQISSVLAAGEDSLAVRLGVDTPETARVAMHEIVQRYITRRNH